MSNNEEQMLAEFNVSDAKEDLAALIFQCARYEKPSTDWVLALDEFVCKVEQAATASKQREIYALNEKIERMSRLATPSDFVREENKALKREIDALNQQVQQYQHDFEVSVRDHELCKCHADYLNQQVLELSAVVEKMRGFIQMLADSSPADDMDSTPFDAQEFLTYLANAPSTALRDYVNEEVAKLQSECPYGGMSDIACERRNRK